MVNIVGAGPTGLWAAAHLAAKGLDVTVFEQKETIGEPVHCTGLISTRIDSLMKLPPELIFNKIKGARLYSSSKKAEITRDQVEAYVIDRGNFDKQLAVLAEAKGAKISLGQAVDALSLEGPTISAEGASSITVKKLGLGLNVLPAPQWIVEDTFDPDYVELHFLRPEFFAWVVPESPTRARVGIAAKKDAVSLLKTFMERRLPNAKVLEQQSGLVNVNGPMKQTVFGDLVLLGDCAGQTKATTGGGIITGLMCAKTLADNFSDWDAYEKNWQSHPGKELRNALKIRNFLSGLNEAGYDKLIRLANKNQELIAQHGDMDFHSNLTKAFLRKPSNWKHLLSLLFARYLF